MPHFCCDLEVVFALGCGFLVRRSVHSNHALMRNLVAAHSLDLLIKTTREHALRTTAVKGFKELHESSPYDVTGRREYLTLEDTQLLTSSK